MDENADIGFLKLNKFKTISNSITSLSIGTSDIGAILYCTIFLKIYTHSNVIVNAVRDINMHS